MVVEDEGIVALDIQSKLEGLGYEVPAVAASAADAIEKAEQIRPDLILMDIQLEGDVDGIEAATQINRQLQIPVIYLSAYSDESTLERAKIAEPMGYLLKPFEERELYATIEIALYKRGSENEKARLEERLKQSEKMEAIGQLTAGLAYNFNNMLHGIIGNLDLASMQAPDELRPFLEDAAYDAAAAARLVSQLMLFYRQEQVEHSRIDINSVIDEVASICGEIFSTKISITVDGDLSMPTVHGDRDQLRRSLVNLCTNARDAVLEDAHTTEPAIRISSSTITFPQEKADQSGVETSPDVVESVQRAMGRYVCISVSDNGVGMDDNTRDHMFEPFFTTKRSGVPNGLGLAVVYGAVRDYGGWVECDSELAEGTTVSIYLPVAESVKPNYDSPAGGDGGRSTLATADSLRGAESVLVIADVDRSRKILHLMLENHGYSVRLGLDGRDGLDLFRHLPDIDLVVLELSAPGMSNQEALAELLKIDPSARVVVVTGHPMGGTRPARRRCC